MDDKRRPIGVMHDGLATALAVKPGQADELREHGADVVVSDLAELLDAT
jgi:phosphoglycolate phosphatase-like HAD superfamily hydrolase